MSLYRNLLIVQKEKGQEADVQTQYRKEIELAFGEESIFISILKTDGIITIKSIGLRILAEFKCKNNLEKDKNRCIIQSLTYLKQIHLVMI